MGKIKKNKMFFFFKCLTREIRFGYGQFITDTLPFFTKSDAKMVTCGMVVGHSANFSADLH